MNGHRSIPPGGGAARRAIRAAALLAMGCAAAFAASVRAGDLTGRADFTGTQDDSPGASSNFLRQSYLLQYARPVSDTIRYRLAMLYQDDRGATETALASARLRTWTVSPKASLDYRLDEFTLGLAYDLDYIGDLDPAIDRTQERKLEHLQATTSAKLLAPVSARLYADTLSFDDSASEVHTRDDRVGFDLQYASDHLRVIQENRVQRFLDEQSRISRLSVGPRLTVAYQQAWGPDASLSATYLLDYQRTEQQAFSPVDVSAPVEQPAAAGLYVRTDLPLDTSGTPMTSDPALIDRSFGSSAGVSIGPDGSSFQNLGLDMGRFLQLDSLRIHVRNHDGLAVPSGGLVTWTVYSSQDGVRWAAVDAASGIFNPAVSAYDLSFPVTTARFFKAVNFGVNGIETLVTELQAFLHETFRPNESHVSSSFLQGVTVTGNVRPARKLALDYSARFNANASTFYQSATVWTTDLGGFVSAKLGPFDALLFEASHGRTRVRQPGGGSQENVSYAASVRFTPIPRYQAFLEGHRSEDTIASAAAVTHGALLSQRIDLLEALKLTGSASYNRQDLARAGSTYYVTGSGVAAVGLTREVDLNFNASLQRTVSRVGDTSAVEGVPQLRIVNFQRYTGEVLLRASEQLNLLARLGYTSSAYGSGMAQTYRASWNPFPDGAIQLGADYSEDVDPLTGQSFRRFTAFPRWTVNRHAALEFSYNWMRGTGRVPLSSQSMLLTLSLLL